ncbi:hypothetical protein EON65_18545 [archaeon]|nr:MAG: hypothetical protein EON65_18545 [archaeon]
MEFENIYNDGQLLLREDYPGEETGSSDTTANVHMDEVNVYGPDRCQTPPSAAFQHKIRTLATPSKPCDLVFSSSENSDFLEEVAKRYGLCEREVAGVRSLIDFLRRDCKILMLPIQQYVHKLLSTKAIYNVDMLLQTLQEDEAYLDVVVGKNVVHRPAILKAVQARQAEQRTKEKQQITPRELQVRTICFA